MWVACKTKVTYVTPSHRGEQGTAQDALGWSNIIPLLSPSPTGNRVWRQLPQTPAENQSQNYHSLVFLQCMKCACTRNTTNTPAEKLGSLGQAGVRAPKAFSRGVNPAATRLTSASSSAGLIAKADVVLLLEEQRSTSSLP